MEEPFEVKSKGEKVIKIPSPAPEQQHDCQVARDAITGDQASNPCGSVRSAVAGQRSADAMEILLSLPPTNTNTNATPTPTTTTVTPSSDVLHQVDENEVVLLLKADKAVCTNDTLEDLRRALTYEAIFASLLEKKVLAMKRDCEERKRAKRMKRKSIGRIFFSKKLFGSGSRKGSMCRADSDVGLQQLPEDGLSGGDPTRKPTNSQKHMASFDEIEVASGSTTESHRFQQHQAHSKRSKSKCAITASASASAITSAEVPGVHPDDSITSTLTNSSERNSSGQLVKRNMLVRAQTHTPAEVRTSSSSNESKDASATPTATARHSTANANSSVLPGSLPERSTYDTASLASGYENGTGARVHTSTMADGSLTSMRDSIESLSFASSRCTVSFGGTEIIPEDTASLLYERARVAKRLRVLEAKSISAQCSPILSRHLIKVIPAPPALPQNLLSPAEVVTKVPSNIHEAAGVCVGGTAARPTAVDTTTKPAMQTKQTQTKARFLPNQVSYSDSMYGCAEGVDALTAAYSRYFSRQNTSEDSANLTVSTLLNQSDSVSLHAPIYTSSAAAAIGSGSHLTSGTANLPFALGDRYKSKSTSLLVTSRNGRSRPPPQLQLLMEPPQGTGVPLEELEQLHITNNLSHSDQMVDSIRNPHVVTVVDVDSQLLSTVCTAAPPMMSPQYYPVITTTAPTATGLDLESATISAFRNDHAPNGAIVTTANMAADTAKLNRMTSTSTGSSVAPTGCCTTTKSSSREREKQPFNNPSWPSGQTGSDDEYRRRKRKYKRYHRCSDPVLVYPSPSGLQHCILSIPPNEPVQFPYNEDYAYDMQIPMELDKSDDLEEIMPSGNRRHRKHRHHKHKKRHRHKKPKILVQDLETQVVKVIDPDDLPQRARWTIIATACLLLLMCLMLVGITLRMAPIIDDMVRQENERLMKETMDRARFGKNYTDTASLISTPTHMLPAAPLSAASVAASAVAQTAADAASALRDLEQPVP